MITACTNDRCYDLRGLSTDTKPTDWHGIKIGNGSTFFCIDTGDLFIFDETNQEWKPM